MHHEFKRAPFEDREFGQRDGERLKSLLSDPDTRFLLIRGDQVLVTAEPVQLKTLLREELDPPINPENPPIFLGIVGDKRWFCIDLAPAATTPAPMAGQQFVSHREALRALSAHDRALLAEALSLLAWARSARFCGRCGSPAELQQGGYECVCTSCGHVQYPRVDPVAIMLVHKGNKILLGRNYSYDDPKRYSCLAGHTHPGEPVEETVRREVLEESGVVVKEVNYVASQPWPFPHKIMLGFTAEAQTDEIVVNKEELADVRWFSHREVTLALNGNRDRLLLPPTPSIARHLIETWANSH